ncbi:polysaccharide biosynthesis C-terminal domain-containing protein [Companilactobacillus pabuli]|uniref:polysaccharide biosynthesis C-terminal domain-containing protein n=1 Tax=Companilactobacillus pabuli TaxID=2714036 RepID=UPI0035184C97
MVSWMLTDKWLPAVPYMQIACIFLALYPINIVNLQAILAVGKSSIYLRLNIIKKGIGFITIISSIPFGPYAMASSDILVGVLAILTNVSANKKLFGYSFYELGKDCIPNAIMSLIMFFSVHIVGLLYQGISSTFGILCIQILVGGGVYVILSMLLNSSDFEYLLSILKIRH